MIGENSQGAIRGGKLTDESGATGPDPGLHRRNGNECPKTRLVQDNGWQIPSPARGYTYRQGVEGRRLRPKDSPV